MKIVKWLVSIGVTFTLFATVVKGFTISGTLSNGFYGSALATQVLASTADTVSSAPWNMGLTNIANGSELDAGYAVVTNGTLYLFLAGNLNTGGAGAPQAYDALNIFFMSDSGAGGDNTLGTNYCTCADDGGRINRMGVGGNGQDPGSTGLTFDNGFYANYYVTINAGGTGTFEDNPTMYADYEVICATCNSGEFLGSSDTTNGPFLVTGGNGIQVALNEANTNGVWGDLNGCPVVNGCPSNCPQTVMYGTELAIPLGDIGNPQSSVSICAFITDQNKDSLYNQVLGPVNGGTNCYSQFANDSSAVNFSALPGKHYFTVPVPPCSIIEAGTYSISMPVTGGTTNVGVTMNGGCAWTATSSTTGTSTNWLTINSGSIGSGTGTITFSVATNLSINPRYASLTITGTAQSVNYIVNISEAGVTLPPLNSFVVDGTLDPLYGCPISVQQIGTGYGKNSSTDLGSANGSELDAAYGLIENNILNLFFAGNLQNNGNHLHIFFMTQPGAITGCPNTITNVEPSVDYDNLNLGFASTNPAAPGLTFDTGFNPNYWIGMVLDGGTPDTLYVNYAQLWPGATNSLGLATNGYYLGNCNPTNGTLNGSINPFGIQVAINNSNTNGVDGSSCVTNSTLGSPCVSNLNAYCAVTVTNGIELSIPLAALGSPTGRVAVCAFIGGGGYQYMSNQILPPINPIGTTNSYCGWPDYVNAAAVNLGQLPGSPHFFYVGPEMGIKSITLTNNGTINISYQTENNTNLLYTVERTYAPLTSTSVWANLIRNVPGTNTVITYSDPKAATNKVGAIYRVLQEPACNP